jgi:transcriptional regulator with XRE-family HTH domain
MENISQQFGQTVRKIRLKQGLSQGDVARRLNLHRSYISSIERGIRNPSLKVIQRIAKALEVPIEKLLEK